MSNYIYQNAILNYEKFVMKFGLVKDHVKFFAEITAFMMVILVASFLAVLASNVGRISQIPPPPIIPFSLAILVLIPMGIYSAFYLYCLLNCTNEQ